MDNTVDETQDVADELPMQTDNEIIVNDTSDIEIDDKQNEDITIASPIQLEAFDIKNCEDDSLAGKFTRVLINNEKYGVLTPEKYRVITNRNITSIQLAKWALKQIDCMTTKFKTSLKGGFISVYIPYRMFNGNHLEIALDRIVASNFFPTNRIAFELSSEVLYESAEDANQFMNHYREKYGVKFILGDFGNEFCPALRLSTFEFEYVISDSSICNEETITSQMTADALFIAKKNNCKVIFGHPDKRLAPLAKENGFDMYISNGKIVPDGRLLNV